MSCAKRARVLIPSNPEEYERVIKQVGAMKEEVACLKALPLKENWDSLVQENREEISAGTVQPKYVLRKLLVLRDEIVSTLSPVSLSAFGPLDNASIVRMAMMR